MICKTLDTLVPSPSQLSLLLYCRLTPVLIRFLPHWLRTLPRYTSQPRNLPSGCCLCQNVCPPQTSAKFAPLHLSESLVKCSSSSTPQVPEPLPRFADYHLTYYTFHFCFWSIYQNISYTKVAHSVSFFQSVSPVFRIGSGTQQTINICLFN